MTARVCVAKAVISDGLDTASVDDRKSLPFNFASQSPGGTTSRWVGPGTPAAPAQGRVEASQPRYETAKLPKGGSKGGRRANAGAALMDMGQSVVKRPMAWQAG